MSLQLGIGAIAALSALWLIVRIHRERDIEVLPPPDPSCQRNSVEAAP